MFIQGRSGYNKDGEQFCKGLFLIIASEPNSKDRRPKLRAKVVTAHMKQLGHWMMANVTLGSFNVVLSGSYGSDGLPFDFRQHFPNKEKENKGKGEIMTDKEQNFLWNQFEPMPPELQEQFWEGGGHNTVGKEGPAMREWALRNLALLKKPMKRFE